MPSLSTEFLNQPLPRVLAPNLVPGDRYLSYDRPVEVIAAYEYHGALYGKPVLNHTTIIRTSASGREMRLCQPNDHGPLIMLPRSWPLHVERVRPALREEIEEAYGDVGGRCVTRACASALQRYHRGCPGWVTPFRELAVPCACLCGCAARRDRNEGRFLAP